MRILKKWLLVGFTISVLLLSFSLSASAADYDFQLSSFPMHSNTSKSTTNAFVNGFIQSDDNNIYYFEIVYGSGSGRLGSTFLPTWQIVSSAPAGSVVPIENYYLVMGEVVKSSSYSMWCDLYVYDLDGILQKYISYHGSSLEIHSSSSRVNKNNFSPSTFDIDFCHLKDANSYIILIDNSYNSDWFSPSNAESIYVVPMSGFDNINYYVSQSSFNVNACSIIDNISVNGELLYVGSPDDPDVPDVPSFVTGSGSGSDGTTTYNYTYEFDVSPFVTPNRQVPNPYDSSGIDDYNSEHAATDEAIDSFRGDYEFSDVFDDFDITEFNDGMSFWEDKFDDIVSSNSIFVVVIVSMLTLGIIVVILNRRVGVG